MNSTSRIVMASIAAVFCLLGAYVLLMTEVLNRDPFSPNEPPQRSAESYLITSHMVAFVLLGAGLLWYATFCWRNPLLCGG